jgi:hypothetical protein
MCAELSNTFIDINNSLFRFNNQKQRSFNKKIEVFKGIIYRPLYFY